MFLESRFSSGKYKISLIVTFFPQNLELYCHQKGEDFYRKNIKFH